MISMTVYICPFCCETLHVSNRGPEMGYCPDCRRAHPIRECGTADRSVMSNQREQVMEARE